MAIARSIQRKAASQAPKDFFQCKQAGGAHGSSKMAPEKPQSGKLREQIYGRKSLGK